jgi:hypothetical protein
VFAIAVISLTGCGGGGGSETKKDLKAVEIPSGPILHPDENGGTITGKVSWAGSKPVVRMLDMSATPFCTRSHPNGAPSEEIVLNPNGTVKNAFVWIKSGLPNGRYEAPPNAVTLDQVGCMYQPHVVALMVGQPLAMKNSDGTNHNIHPTPTANDEWNESQPPGSADRQQAFPKPELMIPVKCNIHPWMRAYVNVVAHPFFAVTGDDGTFTIKGLPPGTYTVELVHEKYGKQEQQVTVGAKESKTADFTVRG